MSKTKPLGSLVHGKIYHRTQQNSQNDHIFNSRNLVKNRTCISLKISQLSQRGKISEIGAHLGSSRGGVHNLRIIRFMTLLMRVLG